MDQRSTAWMLGVLLIALILQSSALAQQYEGCSGQFESFTIPPGRHIHLNEGQYVVPWLNFSCSGNITAWEFAASVQDDRIPDKQVILQLWQPLPNNINPTPPSQFAFITEVVLSTSVEGRFNEERPFSFDLTQPLPVQSGNVLGFSVSNPTTGVRFAAVTASAMEGRLIYYRQTGGTSRRRGRQRGDDGPEDDLEDETEDSSEFTLFNIYSNVNTIPGPHSPLMTIRFSTDVQSGSTAPTFSTMLGNLPPVGQTPGADDSTLADQPSVVASLPPTDHPSVVDSLPPSNQPPAADQDEGTFNPIIIGVVLILAMLVTACVVIVTIVALCSVKRSCVRSMEEGGTAENEKGFPYVKFSQAANDENRHPLVPTMGKYEAVVEHKVVSRDGIAQQMQLLESQSSIASQYAPTYDYIQDGKDYTSVGYYYVPPAVAREGELQEWCKTAALVDVASMNEQSAFPKYENTPYTPPPPVLDELYNQLSSGMCLEIPRTTVKKHTVLGNGQFGEVFKGIWETPYDGPREVAIKMLKEASSHIERVKFLQEAAIMAQFRHPHIVRLLGSVTVDEPSMLILEYLHGGDLRGHLQGCIPYNDIQAIQLLQFCREIADGMMYLSNKGFVHRDLAARNILLDKNLKCKVADFGLSKDLQEGIYYMSRGGKIPVKWTAPEALFYKKYSTSSDVWSYGMLMYEIWSLGHKPFSHMDQAEVLERFQNDVGYIQPPPPGCPREMFKLMVLCWAYDHHSRPTFSQIVSQLADSDSVLLSIPLQCLQDVSHPEEVQWLGKPLQMAHDLYPDLQHYYK